MGGQDVSYCKEHRMIKPGSEKSVLKADHLMIYIFCFFLADLQCSGICQYTCQTEWFVWNTGCCCEDYKNIL